MKIADARDRTALFVRAVKEKTVHQGEDMDFFLSCWRGDDPVALLGVRGARDELVLAAHLAAVGFGSDVIAMSTDTWMATELVHPETGLPWEPGQINEYARAHPEKAKQLTKEMLLTHVINRAGDSTHVFQAYRTFPSPLIKGRTEIEWLDWQPPEGHLAMEGFLPDALRAVMNEPTVDVVLARSGFNVGEQKQWRDHTDLAAVRSARQQIGDDALQILLFAEPDTDRQRLFQSRLGPGEVVEPPDLDL